MAQESAQEIAHPECNDAPAVDPKQKKRKKKTNVENYSYTLLQRSACSKKKPPTKNAIEKHSTTKFIRMLPKIQYICKSYRAGATGCQLKTTPWHVLLILLRLLVSRDLALS